MCYQSDKGKVLLFGGYGGDYLGDTWEWDGNLWTQAADTGPVQRSLSALVYDPVRKKSLLFGGQFQSGSSVITVASLDINGSF